MHLCSVSCQRVDWRSWRSSLQTFLILDDLLYTWPSQGRGLIDGGCVSEECKESTQNLPLPLLQSYTPVRTIFWRTRKTKDVWYKLWFGCIRKAIRYKKKNPPIRHLLWWPLTNKGVAKSSFPYMILLLLGSCTFKVEFYTSKKGFSDWFHVKK